MRYVFLHICYTLTSFHIFIIAKISDRCRKSLLNRFHTKAHMDNTYSQLHVLSINRPEIIPHGKGIPAVFGSELSALFGLIQIAEFPVHPLNIILLHYFWQWGQYTLPRPATLICFNIAPHFLQGISFLPYTIRNSLLFPICPSAS